MRQAISHAAHGSPWNLGVPVGPVWVLVAKPRLKPGPGGSVSLLLTPLELIDRLAALIPPPCQHRHRYYGVLAPNAPLRRLVAGRLAPEG